MKKDPSTKFSHWLSTPVGRQFIATEKRHVMKLPSHHLGGRETIILGSTQYEHLFVQPPVLLTDVMSDTTENIAYTHFSALPFVPESVENIVLPHTLDFSRQPNAILREINIALKPGGNMIILGFNPWSFWGMRRLFAVRKQAPWCGHFRSLWMLKDRLELLNYEVVFSQHFLFRLPILKLNLFEKLASTEKYLRYLGALSGAVYLIMAKKKVFGLTPLRPKWKGISKVLASPRMMNPVANNENAENR